MTLQPTHNPRDKREKKKNAQKSLCGLWNVSLITFNARHANVREKKESEEWGDPFLQHERDQTCDNYFTRLVSHYVFHDTWSGVCDLSETTDSAENNRKEIAVDILCRKWQRTESREREREINRRRTLTDDYTNTSRHMNKSIDFMTSFICSSLLPVRMSKIHIFRVVGWIRQQDTSAEAIWMNAFFKHTKLWLIHDYVDEMRNEAQHDELDKNWIVQTPPYKQGKSFSILIISFCPVWSLPNGNLISFSLGRKKKSASMSAA